jgi:hypothetical protein
VSRNGDGVEVVQEKFREFEESGTVANVVVLRVPESEKFPDGVKVRMHYGHASGDDEPILRYDNSHGEFEKHVGGRVESVDFDGYEAMLEDFEREVKEREGRDKIW